MLDIPTPFLISILLALLVLSAFFSSSETALMSLDRHRLKRLAKEGHRGAIYAERLLQRPDRLLSLILLGNNFVNVLASSLTTLLALRLFGEQSIALAAGILTLVLLIFAEVAPKTMAATKPERLAFPAAYVYIPLLRISYPLVWLINLLAWLVLRPLRIIPGQGASDVIGREELRHIVEEAREQLASQNIDMLGHVMDMEQASVSDVMVPRNEILSVDLKRPMADIKATLINSPHNWLPLYEDRIDHIKGILHLRRLLRFPPAQWSQRHLEYCAEKPFFIPAQAPLSRQLNAFRLQQRQIGLVVDEYGDIQGLLTLQDLLEGLIGKHRIDGGHPDILSASPQDGSVILNPAIEVREAKQFLDWDLPIDGPRTLNGLILEHMETIPRPGTSFLLYGRPLEVLKMKENSVLSVRVLPPLKVKNAVEGE